MDVKNQWLVALCVTVAWLIILAYSTFSLYAELMVLWVGALVFAGVSYYLTYSQWNKQWLLVILVALPILVLFSFFETYQWGSGGDRRWYYFAINAAVGFIFWISTFYYRHTLVTHEAVEATQTSEFREQDKGPEAKLFKMAFRLSLVLGVLIVFPAVIFSLGEIFGKTEVVQFVQTFMMGVLLFAIPIVLLFMLRWIRDVFRE